MHARIHTNAGERKPKLVFIFVRARSLWSSDSQQVDAELGSAAAVRVHHVERLRVPGPDDPLEPGPHVHEVALLGGGWAGDVVREHAGADGHRLDGAEHFPHVAAALPAHGEPALAPVAVGAPRRLLQQRAALLPCTGSVSSQLSKWIYISARKQSELLVCKYYITGGERWFLALEREADEARGHLPDERGGGVRGHLDEQHGRGARFRLQRDVHAPAPPAEDGARHARPQLPPPPPVRDHRQERRPQPCQRVRALPQRRR
jgi:hypothetical protein